MLTMSWHCNWLLLLLLLANPMTVPPPGTLSRPLMLL
jgi:hypothetical protein